jgi:8-oxo-dGTP pyrophosphatase MutT (NUDIX family)
MHYTIYFNQKPLLLTDTRIQMAEQLLQKPNTLYYHQLNNASVSAIIREIQQPNVSGGVFIHSPLDELLEAFKQQMKVVEAGGGLVHTNNATVLLIYRNGKWDLPKGKLDEGEATDAAAVREVREETGLEQLQLEEPLTITYHTYYQDKVLILKESHWYLMKSPEQKEMVPQLEEGIEKCEWVKPDALAPYLENTHPSIIDVLQCGIKKLHAQKSI